MDEKWIEEIKHNDGMVLLDRFFPGKSCGNPECEKRCIDFCKIALRIGALKPEEISAVVASQLVIPENCPTFQGGSNDSCRFHVLPSLSISVYDDYGRKIIAKKYISDADASQAGVAINVLNMPIGFINGRKKQIRCRSFHCIQIANVIMKIFMNLQIIRSQSLREILKASRCRI